MTYRRLAELIALLSPEEQDQRVMIVTRRERFWADSNLSTHNEASDRFQMRREGIADQICIVQGSRSLGE